MKYKEKHAHHLRHALGAVALSLAMLVPTGCTEKKENSVEPEKQGLLDSTPIRTIDKYNADITLYLAEIPLYERNGERKQDQYILTRGLKKSEYIPAEEERYIRKAFINGSKEPVYVQACADGAVPTKDGTFVGLFLDENGKMLVVADKSIPEFIEEQNEKKYERHHAQSSYASEHVAKLQQRIEKRDSADLVIARDSTVVDAAQAPTDSVSNVQRKQEQDADTMPADTLNFVRQKIRE